MKDGVRIRILPSEPCSCPAFCWAHDVTVSHNGRLGKTPLGVRKVVAKILRDTAQRPPTKENQ